MYESSGYPTLPLMLHFVISFHCNHSRGYLVSIGDKMGYIFSDQNDCDSHLYCSSANSASQVHVSDGSS